MIIITNHLKHYSYPILTHRGTCLFELETKRSCCRRPTKRRIAAVVPAVPWSTTTTTTSHSADTHWIRFRLGMRSVWNRTSCSPGLAPARSRRKRRNTAGRPAVAIVETTWTWSGVTDVGTLGRVYRSKGDDVRMDPKAMDPKPTRASALTVRWSTCGRVFGYTCIRYQHCAYDM